MTAPPYLVVAQALASVWLPTVPTTFRASELRSRTLVRQSPATRHSNLKEDDAMSIWLFVIYVLVGLVGWLWWTRMRVDGQREASGNPTPRPYRCVVIKPPVSYTHLDVYKRQRPRCLLIPPGAGSADQRLAGRSRSTIPCLDEAGN